MFKLIHGIEDFDLSKLVSFNDNTTHGHTLKLNKPRCLKSLRLNAFPARCIDSWNKLPNDLVCSKSVDTFKNRLDVICRVTRFDTRGGTKHHKPPQTTTRHHKPHHKPPKSPNKPLHTSIKQIFRPKLRKKMLWAGVGCRKGMTLSSLSLPIFTKIFSRVSYQNWVS